MNFIYYLNFNFFEEFFLINRNLPEPMTQNQHINIESAKDSIYECKYNILIYNPVQNIRAILEKDSVGQEKVNK